MLKDNIQEDMIFEFTRPGYEPEAVEKLFESYIKPEIKWALNTFKSSVETTLNGEPMFSYVFNKEKDSIVYNIYLSFLVPSSCDKKRLEVLKKMIKGIVEKHTPFRILEINKKEKRNFFQFKKSPHTLH